MEGEGREGFGVVEGEAGSDCRTFEVEVATEAGPGTSTDPRGTVAKATGLEWSPSMPNTTAVSNDQG